MTTTTKPDSSHLKEGMSCTIRFRHPDDWNKKTEPVSGTLEDVFGGLMLGRSVIRRANGTTSETVAEVVNPAPPKQWPVGTRLTDGQVRAILTNDGNDKRWFVYDGEGYGLDEFGPTWRTDADVSNWTPVEDDRPEVVDLPDGVELAHDEGGHLWARRVWRGAAVAPWLCLTAAFTTRDDDDAARWPRVAVAPSLALPEGHIAVDPWGLAEYITARVSVEDFTGDLAVSALEAAILLYSRRGDSLLYSRRGES